MEKERLKEDDFINMRFIGKRSKEVVLQPYHPVPLPLPSKVKKARFQGFESFNSRLSVNITLVWNTDGITPFINRLFESGFLMCRPMFPVKKVCPPTPTHTHTLIS